MTNGLTGRYPIGPAVIGVAVHHSVSGAPFFDAIPDTEADEIAHLRAIDRYHNQPPDRDWGGFGYHLAAFPSGRWYYCGDLHGARAHVAGRNNELIGIVLIGDFRDQAPPDTQLTAAAHAVAFIQREYPAIPLAGHRAWALASDPTACPGTLFWLYHLQSPREEIPMTLNIPLLQREGDDEVYADLFTALVHIPEPKYVADWDAVRRVPPDDPTFDKPTFYPDRDRRLP